MRSSTDSSNRPDPTERKILSAFCHGATFLSFSMAGILVPIIVLCITKDDVVKENAKEALNYHIAFFVYYVIAFILCFLLIGIPLLVFLVIADFILSIMAIVHCLTDTHRPYYYPMIFRVL